MYPDWNSLPGDIVDSVFKRIESPLDYLRCSIVCKSWHRVANDNQIQQAKMMSNSHHPPMLLIPAEEEDTFNLYSIREEKALNMQVTVPPNYKWFSGSSKGWLIALDENFVVTLINPFGRVKGKRAKENSIIRLPPLTHQPLEMKKWSRFYPFYLTRATISADPVLYPDDCIVVIVFPRFYELAFFRLNKDTSWTYITGQNSLKLYFDDVFNIQNRFYALNRCNKLLSFDITDEFHSDVEFVTCSGDDSGPDGSKRYLVYLEDERELLVVNRSIEYKEEEGGGDKRTTTEFRVFGLDLEKYEFVEKTTLGGISIFLGDNSSLAVLASKFPGCEPNCLYYNHDHDGYGFTSKFLPHDYGVYNFKTNTFNRETYKEKVKIQLERRKPHPIWIVPTFHL